MGSKVWWKSKTVWVGAVALAASLAQAKWGIIIDPATQGIILSIIMIILRLDTKECVSLTKPVSPVATGESKTDEILKP